MSARYAGQHERKSSDQRLVAGLRTAAVAYKGTLKDAAEHARALAKSRRVQRAFLRHDRARLDAIQASHEHIVLSMPSTAPVSGAATRSFDVVSGGRIIGRVMAAIPLNGQLVASLARQAELPHPLQLGLVRGNELIGTGTPVRLRSRLPATVGDVVAGSTTYRAAVAPFERTTPPLSLVALEPKGAIDAAAAQVPEARPDRRLRVHGGARLSRLLVAPGIARNRVSRQERVQAERVLAHVGDGIFLVDPAGVVRLWNAAAEAITGIRAKAVINRPAREKIPGWPAIEAMVPIASRPGDPERPGRRRPSRSTLREGRSGCPWSALRSRRASSTHSETSPASGGSSGCARSSSRRSRIELRTPLASLHGAALTLREHSDLAAETSAISST